LWTIDVTELVPRDVVQLGVGDVVPADPRLFEKRIDDPNGWIVEDVASEPFRLALSDAFDASRPLIDGEPRIARAVYAWEREEATS
jgi:hypothetical protein